MPVRVRVGHAVRRRSNRRNVGAGQRRLTVIGALYLSAVCILPELLIARGGVPFYFGGTSLLIVVSVTLDTVTQIQAHLLAHQYEGLIKKARLRGRR